MSDTIVRDWQQVLPGKQTPARPGSRRMNALARGSEGLVAVGADEEAKSAAVWLRTDLRQWTRIRHDERVFGGAGQQEMIDAVEGGPGLVVVGYDTEQGAAVWNSTSGLDWQRVPHQPNVFGGPGDVALEAVTAGGPGFVAVGSDRRLGAAAVFTSTDGTTWQRVAHDPVVFADAAESHDVQMLGVSVGGPGLVAVGGDRTSGQAVVWTSPDGIAWSRQTDRRSVFGGGERPCLMRRVVQGGPGLVAVGTDEDLCAAAVWTSTDGMSWQRVPHVDDIFASDDWVEMLDVVVGPQGLVAVGYDESDTGVVWSSPDGEHWTRIGCATAQNPPPRGQELHAVAVDGNELIAVGRDADLRLPAVWTEWLGDDWIWIAPSEYAFPNDKQEMLSVASCGSELVAVGFDAAPASAAVWRSHDGQSWVRVPHDEQSFGGPGFQAMLSVVRGEQGLVAVGVDTRRGAAVWTSTNGSVWQRVAHDEAAFGVNCRIYDVAVGGPGLVAVGEDQKSRDAVVWTSPDGQRWHRAAHDPTVFGSAGQQNMRSVVTGGPGMVAVGYDYDGSACHAAVWTSRDGLTWQRVDEVDGVFSGEGDVSMTGIAATDSGLVAVGEEKGAFATVAAVWTSTDGCAWVRIDPHQEAALIGGGCYAMRAVTATSRGLVAVGDIGNPDGADASVWTSNDGNHWQQTTPTAQGPNDGACQIMRDVTEHGEGQLVIVGNHDLNPAAWIG